MKKSKCDSMETSFRSNGFTLVVVALFIITFLIGIISGFMSYFLISLVSAIK